MIYADGFVLGSNPSSKGGGYTLTDGKGKVLIRRTIDARDMKPVGDAHPVFTNNDGELRGVVHALIIARHNDVVITDSKTAYAWVTKGKSKVRPDLNEICAIGRAHMLNKKVELRWAPRDRNLAGISNENYGKKKEPYDHKKGEDWYNKLPERSNEAV